MGEVGSQAEQAEQAAREWGEVEQALEGADSQAEQDAGEGEAEQDGEERTW